MRSQRLSWRFIDALRKIMECGSKFTGFETPLMSAIEILIGACEKIGFTDFRALKFQYFTLWITG